MCVCICESQFLNISLTILCLSFIYIVLISKVCLRQGDVRLWEVRCVDMSYTVDVHVLSPMIYNRERVSLLNNDI